LAYIQGMNVESKITAVTLEAQIELCQRKRASARVIIDDALTSSEDRSKARYELYLLSKAIKVGQERLASLKKKTT
jgi:hypothetical protein